MMTNLLRLRFSLNAPRHLETRTLAKRERSKNQAASIWELEFERHVAIGWQIAVNFDTDADFDQNGRCPGHYPVLPWAFRKVQ